ncbi:hypothetical protein CPB85DRAFT_1264412, partial [Mucidula mucida]
KSVVWRAALLEVGWGFCYTWLKSCNKSLVLHPLKASQAGGMVNTLRECSSYTVGEGNMGRGLRDVDGESVYASTGSRLVLYPLKASQAGGVVNTLRECSTYTVGVVNMGRGLSGSLRRFKLVKLVAWSMYVRAVVDMGLSPLITVRGKVGAEGEWYLYCGRQYFGAASKRLDVDGESVDASPGSSLVLYPLKASQAGGVVNTLRECSSYTVGEGNMGRGLRDVDGESVYASTGSRLVLYPLKASQAGGVVNTLRECSTYTVGVVNMGRGLSGSLRRFKLVKLVAWSMYVRAVVDMGLSPLITVRGKVGAEGEWYLYCGRQYFGAASKRLDVDGESVDASPGSSLVLYPLKASQAGGVVNTFKECSTYIVGASNIGTPLDDYLSVVQSGKG